MFLYALQETRKLGGGSSEEENQQQETRIGGDYSDKGNLQQDEENYQTHLEKSTTQKGFLKY
jgi:hypothetical protein